jgi:DNA-binding PadR family transcriptional regulator
MAVREALLALLVDGPKHGYQLKNDFESATGSAWPLNVGQVYTTLQRLERDGLVDAAGDPDDDGRLPYAITDSGHRELDRWLATPTAAPIANRDETSMRVLLALATGALPIDQLVASQRQAAMATLQSMTAMKAEPDQPLAWRLQLDRMIFLAEAELRWLDLTEERLASDADGRPNRAEPTTQAVSPDDRATERSST